jgi:hypothetical protein
VIIEKIVTLVATTETVSGTFDLDFSSSDEQARLALRISTGDPVIIGKFKLGEQYEVRFRKEGD